PTLLVTFGQKLDAQALLSAIDAIGYPASDVHIYHRPMGSDQVIDAITGQIPAGEAINPNKLKSKETQNLETLILMHPNGTQFVALQTALKQFGDADYKYSEATVFEGEHAEEAE